MWQKLHKNRRTTIGFKWFHLLNTEIIAVTNALDIEKSGCEYYNEEKYREYIFETK